MAVCHAVQPHARELTVLVEGEAKRLCQQCSTFHPLADFDGTKRYVGKATAIPPSIQVDIAVGAPILTRCIDSPGCAFIKVLVKHHMQRSATLMAAI
jgi:SBP domain